MPKQQRSIRMVLSEEKHARLVAAWDAWTAMNQGSDKVREAMLFLLDFYEGKGVFSGLADVPIDGRLAELTHRLKSPSGSNLTLATITAALREALADFRFIDGAADPSGTSVDQTSEFAKKVLTNLAGTHDIDEGAESWEE